MDSEKQLVTIGELCDAGLAELQTGPFGSQLHAYDYVDDGVAVVPTEAIRDRKIDHSVLPKITPAKAHELARHRLHRGDILFARRGVQATGHVGYVRATEAGFICGTGAIRLRLAECNGKISSNFMSHVLANPASIEWFKFHAIGATMPNLNEGIIRSFPLMLPPLRDQQAIADLLSVLDDKIEINHRINETLETMARAIFNDWFVDFGPTRAKMEGRTPYLAPEIWSLFPDRLDHNGAPEGWGETKVEGLLELAYGKSLPASDREEGVVPVYGSGGINGYHNRALVDGPAIIVGRKGTIGSLYWEHWPCFPIDTVFYVRSELPLVYCYHLLETLGLTEMNTDAAVPGLNRANVYRLVVPRASGALIDFFASTVGSFRARAVANAQENTTLAATRDLLLPKLVSGEVRVKDAEKVVEAVA